MYLHSSHARVTHFTALLACYHSKQVNNHFIQPNDHGKQSNDRSTPLKFYGKKILEQNKKTIARIPPYQTEAFLPGLAHLHGSLNLPAMHRMRNEDDNGQAFFLLQSDLWFKHRSLHRYTAVTHRSWAVSLFITSTPSSCWSTKNGFKCQSYHLSHFFLMYTHST